MSLSQDPGLRREHSTPKLKLQSPLQPPLYPNQDTKMNLVKASLIVVTVYAGLAASQVSDDQVMPWWPNSQDRQNIKVGESSLEDQTQEGIDYFHS